MKFPGDNIEAHLLEWRDMIFLLINRVVSLGDGRLAHVGVTSAAVLHQELLDVSLEESKQEGADIRLPDTMALVHRQNAHRLCSTIADAMPS